MKILTTTNDYLNVHLSAALEKARSRAVATLANDRGMSTIEYAMGSLAAAALAAVLYLVVNGSGVVSAIEGIITDALSRTPS
ncbi:DUF4244 domain-containing protein [Corynebacterium aquatimens]|uniref:DUF4244 domain-containing protein n=1 Tax=Corynebacterium aquatimens TaxID=1190508 RepID=A0A931E244_9CORY|nr:DUF4244 domain-containing protein [Corynebacterium aquatimens]MBG6122527.1 hypothetical protein [Corynebacterium aquatimens]WJY64933.1 hypothetical protein CAQUA_00965 [Corynebacterium aquatimens]